MAKANSERLCNMILRGWRHKATCRTIAKKINHIQRALVCQVFQTWHRFHLDIEHMEDLDENISRQTFATTFQERLLRLALPGWRNTDSKASAPNVNLQRTSSLIASFLSDASTALSE